MSAPSLDRPVRHRSRRADAEGAATAAPPASAIESPAVRAILEQAAEEAARLLGADGTFLYLLDRETNRLRLTHDAGIQDLGDLPWVRRMEVEVGKGLFGKAVAERRVMLTGDYPDDRSFVHAPGPDRIVREVGIRSLVVAPMAAGDEVYGAIGTFSRARDAFTAPQIALVRSLADHAAQAITNARLIEELDRSRTALSRRAELEKALREIGARISAASDPAEVVQRAVDEALRLVGGEGARIDLVDPRINLLRGSYTGGAEPPTPEQWPDDPDETLDEGVSGKVVTEGVTFWTGNYLDDTRFRHAKGPDTFARATGIRSAIAAPLIAEHGPFGALTVWSRQPDAFGPDEAGVLETIAGQAAVALGRARLIEQLDRSRDELARRADEERTLREIAARLSEIRNPSEVLQRIVGEVRRLLGAERCRLDLSEPVTGRLLWSDPTDMVLHDRAAIPPGDPSQAKGLTAIAIRERRALVSEAYLDDARFEHYAEADREARELGLTSIVVVPVIGESGLLGVLQAAHQRRAAFGDDEVRLVEALASHAAIAITNARLIDRLEQSQAALARTAAAERALREIAARVTVLHEPAQVLESIIEEAPRLVAGDWALIDIVEPTGGRTQWTWPPGQGESGRTTAGIAAVRAGKQARRGLSSRAIVERRAVITGDYLADRSFRHDPTSDAYARSIGMTSVIAAPMFGDGGLLGMLQVGSRRAEAFGPDDAARIEVLADQAAIAVTNARLIEELASSREALRRTADAERTLREIVAELTTIGEPREVLQRIVDAAKRLAGSDMSFLHLLDPATGRLRFEVADQGVEDVTLLDETTDERDVEEGISGLAVRMRRAVRTRDYLSDDRFVHSPSGDALARAKGHKAAIATPLLAEGMVLGVLSVVATDADRFDETVERQLSALADQAAIAIRNAELIRALGQSREETARRAETERTLREIAARITAIRDPQGILELIVEEARRVLGSDGAHLTRMAEDERVLRPVVVAGAEDPETAVWIKGLEFPVDGGINGLAASIGRVVWTPDYAMDPRIPRDPSDLSVADRLRLGAMAAAPLRAPGGEVIGTLAVNYARPGPIPGDRLEVLQALADHAAIALSNSDLYTRLEASEREFRGLVQASPDVIWRNDAAGRFTFIADSAEQLFGWRADELIGQPYGIVVAESDVPQALTAWEQLRAAPDASWRIRILLRRRDGSAFPAEVSAVAFWEDGAFAGAQGTLRDISDRERLERELRESEERYRFLVENSPDIIFSTDAQGSLTYVSETVERALGYRPEQLLGRPFADIAEGVPGEERGRRFAEMAADPSKEMVFRYLLLHADGRAIPFEVSARGLVRDGRFAGVYGAARDMTERERLERELRDSEGRYRFLVQSSPDMVWVTDVDGRFTFVSDTTAQIVGWTPGELVGRTFDDLAPAHVRRRARTLFRHLARRPNQAHRSRLPVMTRDGRELTMEISGIAMLVDGRFAGAHGAARDVSERDRLERDLRRQAAELASSEERSHLARELHDSVTQALFSMTLLSRSIEMLLTRDPAQVPAKLAALRDLQRDALAEMRALIFELRPGNVAENGLIAALRTHAAGLSGRIGLPVVLEGELPERPSLEVEDTLYRIAQEALHNIVKHAGAREVRIEVEPLPDAVRLVVRDDGRGFDPERVPAGHLGLAGMRARAEKLGGRITVNSRPGRGTVVECIVPTSGAAESLAGARGG